MCSKWYSQTPEDVVHVYPRGDLRDHEMTRKCWCNPVEEEAGIIVHNSLDGRTDYEQGRKLQ